MSLLQTVVFFGSDAASQETEPRQMEQKAISQTLHSPVCYWLLLQRRELIMTGKYLFSQILFNFTKKLVYRVTHVSNMIIYASTNIIIKAYLFSAWRRTDHPKTLSFLGHRWFHKAEKKRKIMLILLHTAIIKIADYPVTA